MDFPLLPSSHQSTASIQSSTTNETAGSDKEANSMGYGGTGSSDSVEDNSSDSKAKSARRTRRMVENGEFVSARELEAARGWYNIAAGADGDVKGGQDSQMADVMSVLDSMPDAEYVSLKHYDKKVEGQNGFEGILLISEKVHEEFKRFYAPLKPLEEETLQVPYMDALAGVYPFMHKEDYMTEFMPWPASCQIDMVEEAGMAEEFNWWRWSFGVVGWCDWRM